MNKIARLDRSGADSIKAFGRAARLSDDETFHDLGFQAQKQIRKNVFDTLIAFKNKKYELEDAVAAISVALCRTLAILHRDMRMTPADLGRLAADELVKARQRGDGTS